MESTPLSRSRDSNSEPLPYHGSALPLELDRQLDPYRPVVTMASRFNRGSSRQAMACRYQGNRIRTYDLSRPRGARYQTALYPAGGGVAPPSYSLIRGAVRVMRLRGIEPRTYRLKGGNSLAPRREPLTTELQARKCGTVYEAAVPLLSGRRDSNPRPLGSKPSALPDCATPC